MKILQVIPYFCFGGAETMCENLTYALRDLGHDVVVVSLFDERTEISGRMEAAGVRIRYLGKKPGLDVSVVPKLMKIFREERPDVVHTHLNVILYAVMAAFPASTRCTMWRRWRRRGLPRPFSTGFTITGAGPCRWRSARRFSGR